MIFNNNLTIFIKAIQRKCKSYLPSFIVNANSETNNELDLLIKNNQDDFNNLIKEILPLITKENLYPSKDNFDPNNFHKVIIKIISLLPSMTKDQIAYNYTKLREATLTITDV